MRASPTLAGVAVAFLAILVAPFFTAPGYSSITNAVSELAAQATPNAWIMRVGFVAYGIGVLIDALRGLRRAPIVSLAFAVFGLAMIMTAVFSHRPIDPALSYDLREDELHSLFANIVGTSFTFGTVARSFVEANWRRRLACYGAAASAVLLSLGMVSFPEIQGMLQRLIFGIGFVWLAVFLPGGEDRK